MSKSLGNYIGIYEEPKEIFGKTMRISDGLMRKYFELATDMAIDEIDSTLEGHPRQAKIILGKAIVSRYYDNEQLEGLQRSSTGFLKITNFRIIFHKSSCLQMEAKITKYG